MQYFIPTGQLVKELIPTGIYQGFSQSGKPIVLDAVGNTLTLDVVARTTLGNITQLATAGFLLYKGIRLLQSL